MFRYIISISISLIFIVCHREETIGEFTLKANFDKNLEKIASKRIYFGHQSVGNNIIMGLQEILPNKPLKYLNIIESVGDAPESRGFFLHIPIGENTRPKLKCDDFIKQLSPELVKKLDYAMFKFCYIDINRKTDVLALFEYYRKTITQVRDRYPELNIIHITSPVRNSPDDLQTKIKELIGKFIGKQNNSKLDNVKRNEFNFILKEYFKGEPIFDLARAEATYPDGREKTFKMNGKTNYSLIGEYTYDGGHLNEFGRKKVAADLIAFLASL